MSQPYRNITDKQKKFLTYSLMKIGFRLKYRGTLYLIELISTAYSYNAEIININDLYNLNEKCYSRISYEGFRSSIKYSFRNINLKRTETYFKEIFNFSYSYEFLNPKILIEEFVTLLETIQ